MCMFIYFGLLDGYIIIVYYLYKFIDCFIYIYNVFYIYLCKFKKEKRFF